GKDSLSMTQKYPNNEKVISPGTVIVSAGGEVSDVKKVVSPVMVNDKKSTFYHIDFSFDQLRLGGSAFAQSHNHIGSDVPTIQNPDYFKDAFMAVQTAINNGWILAGHDISAGGLITTLLEMCFANNEGGMQLSLDRMKETDIVKLLFAENPGVVVQVSKKYKHDFKELLDEAGVSYVKLGSPTDERHILLTKEEATYQFGIDYLRDIWYTSSYLLDRKQSKNGCAKQRFENYKQQPIEFTLPKHFTGKLSDYGLSADRETTSGVKAAIIRAKGTNGEREMAYALYLAGFDVKDVTMTDLSSGRETLNDIQMIVFCGGFSNSDVLGSAKGWAGSFLFNEQAKSALDRFYARQDTLSLGICNGCQLMIELGLIHPTHTKKSKMLHNDSHKFESAYVGVTIPTNRSVLFGSLSGSRLGIWVAHGEGKFALPYPATDYNIVAEYSYSDYPGNPNGSDYNTAALCSDDGRHVAMMPHLERSIFPWQNAYYPSKHQQDEVTPWIEAFVNARKWIEQTKEK
ncbi:MAG: phosphoribosylformylglycinamidine synthase subunit PurQ, partial [Bacteroidaceae bacterium]